MAKRKSLQEAVSKEIKSKFDLSSFKEKNTHKCKEIGTHNEEGKTIFGTVAALESVKRGVLMHPVWGSLAIKPGFKDPDSLGTT